MVSLRAALSVHGGMGQRAVTKVSVAQAPEMKGSQEGLEEGRSAVGRGGLVPGLPCAVLSIS